jgi:hypothetical protein
VINRMVCDAGQERGAFQASRSCFPFSVTTVGSSFFPGDCKSIPM